MYWDGEAKPSVEAPLGDFFGLGLGDRRSFFSVPLSMAPSKGKSMVCYFPMPFETSAVVTLENQGEEAINFYYYFDYEEYSGGMENFGRFHAQYRQEKPTAGWADPSRDMWAERGPGAGKEHPDWFPATWETRNTTGEANYVILEAGGRGHYVGCNLSVNNVHRQANDWYGEGDDMIFIDGEAWPPSLHGTGTEDYFNTAYCPREEFSADYFGITRYSGDDVGRKFGGANSMYRYHVLDPVHFRESIRVTIEHGHNNLLSNEYSSTAYWYQTEPHEPGPDLPPVDERIPTSPVSDE
jgi:hypothetical protein